MSSTSGQLGNFGEEVQQAIEKIAAAGTSYDLFRVLKAITIGVGYDKFIIFRLPEERSAQLADLAIITNWEPELIKAYDAKDLLANSPVIERLASSVLPFHWDIVELNKGRKDGSLEEALDLFRDFGLHNGTYFPVSDKHGGRGAFGLAGDRGQLTDAELRDLVFLANHVYERLTDIENITPARSVVLTERERDCVYWTAAGKTSGEVGIILEISENTVNHYLSSAAGKLDTANKAHTVAKAIRLGLLNSRL